MQFLAWCERVLRAFVAAGNNDPVAFRGHVVTERVAELIFSKDVLAGADLDSSPQLAAVYDALTELGVNGLVERTLGVVSWRAPASYPEMLNDPAGFWRSIARHEIVRGDAAALLGRVTQLSPTSAPEYVLLDF